MALTTEARRGVDLVVGPAPLSSLRCPKWLIALCMVRPVAFCLFGRGQRVLERSGLMLGVQRVLQQIRPTGGRAATGGRRRVVVRNIMISELSGRRISVPASIENVEADQT